MENKRCPYTATLAVLFFGLTISFSATAAEPEPTLEKPPEPPIEEEAEPEVKDERERPAPVERGGREILIEDFRVVGNQAIPDAEIDRILSKYEGRQLTLFEIYQVADELTGIYHDRGYGLASVTVPAQKVEDGQVLLEVIEGRVAKINVTGNRAVDFEFVEDQLDRLEPGRVFRSDDLESELLLLNDMPGITARAVVSPGEEFGTSNLLIKVEEDRYDYNASLDNYGRDAIGELRLGANAGINTLFLNGDRLGAGIVESESNLLTYARLSYGLPVGNWGGRIRASYNYADYDVGGAIFGAASISGTNEITRVEYSHPFERSRRFNTVGGVAFKRTTTEVDLLGGLLTNETELNLLELSWYVNQVFDGGSHYSLLTTFDGNGKSYDQPATVSFPPAPRDDQKAKLRVDGNHVWRFARRWSLRSRMVGVYSSDPLVDTEKFSLGGPYSVRAFVPAEARGDRGLYLYVGTQRRFDIGGGHSLPVTVFVDGGQVRRLPLSDAQETAIANGTLDDDNALASAGFTVGLSSNSWYRAELTWATNISNHVPSDGDDSRFWARFVAEF